MAIGGEKRRENIFRVRTSFGGGFEGLCWWGGKKSTHYARAIAVFKTSLSLCVTHLSCLDGLTEAGAGLVGREEGGGGLD